MALLVELPRRSLTPIEHIQRLRALEEKALEEGGTKDMSAWTSHLFCNGSYVRRFDFPAGLMATGEIHRYPCINIVAKGRIKVVQSDGEQIREAGDVWISGAGEKKALYAFEDTVFLTVHVAEQATDQELREKFTVPYENALEFHEQLRLEDN